jgi:hypothetical protein
MKPIKINVQKIMKQIKINVQKNLNDLRKGGKGVLFNAPLSY